MFDYAAATNIDRLSAEHQRHIDDEAAEQDLQEAEEQAIAKDPNAVADALSRLDHEGWLSLAILIGKLVSQYQYHGEERDQGILDVAQEIYDLCYPAIREQAMTNRRKALRGEV